jgi:hypothetical protein
MVEVSSLRAVSAAIAAATHDERLLYVERVGRGWRWSLVHRGGPYPLLRITARFLRIDYRHLTISCRTVGDDYTIVSSERHPPSTAEAWALIAFDGTATPRQVEARIREILHTAVSR